jgi:hypothetical protein
MTGYYYIINSIKEYLASTGLINTITVGDIYKVDLAKQTLFPLSHIIANNAQLSDNTITLNISILFMDIVDESKIGVVNIFDSNDNELDVLNTQLTIANRFASEFLRGDLYSQNIQIIGVPNAEPFVDRFENKLAGWTLTFDLVIPNDMTIC